MIKKSFPVIGMHCASCASIIKRKLENLKGIEECNVNYGTEKTQVSFNPKKVSIQNMNDAIGKYGYSLMDDGSMPNINHNSHSGHMDHEMMTPISSDASVKEYKLKELEKLRRHIQIIIPMVFVSLFVMAWEIGSNNLGVFPKMPDIVMNFFNQLLPLLATYSLFVVGLPYLKGMLRFFKYRVADMDSLVGIGTSVAFLYSFLVLAFAKVLTPYIDVNQTYFDTTIVVIGFITLGKYLEARSKLKTGEAIEKLLKLQAKTATILKGKDEFTVSIDEIGMGDIVIVKPGQMIPLDGIITLGSSTIDESMISGEGIPVDKRRGDNVIGGTINKQGSLQVTVTKVGKETILAQIISMVEEAQGSKAPIERLADKVSEYFVPTVFISAIVVFFLWLILGSQFLPPTQAFTIGILSLVGILIIACPCAMGLATPTAIIVGVGKASEHGILIKNAENLEKLASINYVVLDKTGTLTKGIPELTDIKTSLTTSEVLSLLGSLESHSEHPLAQAVTTYVKKQKLSLHKVTDFTNLEGKGLKGVINGKVYYAGNLKLVKDLGVKIDDGIILNLATEGKTPVILITQKEVIAYIGIADTIKDDAKAVIESLHKLGLKVALLTGDHQRTAQYIAKQVGIDQVIAEVLPGEKANEIRKLQKEGYNVAMIGDGINDAPALASADVGIAMSTGTDIAIESAGITLLGGQLSKLPKAFNLAKETMKIIKQNLFWAFFYNILGIPIAAGVLYPFFGILLNPAIAGAAMGFSSVSVVANSLRLKTVKV